MEFVNALAYLVQADDTNVHDSWVYDNPVIVSSGFMLKAPLYLKSSKSPLY